MDTETNKPKMQNVSNINTTFGYRQQSNQSINNSQKIRLHEILWNEKNLDAEKQQFLNSLYKKP
jgi:hypothetical protein